MRARDRRQFGRDHLLHLLDDVLLVDSEHLVDFRTQHGGLSQQLGELIGCSGLGGRLRRRWLTLDVVNLRLILGKVVVRANRPDEAKSKAGKIKRAMEDFQHVQLIAVQHKVLLDVRVTRPSSHVLHQTRAVDPHEVTVDLEEIFYAAWDCE